MNSAVESNLLTHGINYREGKRRMALWDSLGIGGVTPPTGLPAGLEPATFPRVSFVGIVAFPSGLSFIPELFLAGEEQP